jgi:ATP-binding protein involved in chromosome partitioning
MAAQYEIPLLGQLPLAMEIREGLDNGRPIVAVNPGSPLADAYMAFARRTAGALSITPRNRKLDLPQIQVQNT